MHRNPPIRSRRVKTAFLIIGAAAVIWLFRHAVIQSCALILGACLIAFLASPLALRFEKALPRSLAAFLAIFVCFGSLAGIILLVLPVMIRQAHELAHLLPRSVNTVSEAAGRIGAWFSTRLGIGDISKNLFNGAGSAFADLAGETIALAGNIAGFAGRAALMVVLGFFFICEREELLLRLELFIPAKHRTTAVRMGHAVLREMRMYLRGQLAVASAVAALSTAGLIILRVPGAFALGPVIGLLNMIPYFGPFIGGIPAVLIALADGWQKAAYTVVMIFIVQQLDNSFISPRVMGHLTGISPALVLIAVFAGSQLGGIVGMLSALPLIMTFRTLFRVFVQRHENI